MYNVDGGGILVCGDRLCEVEEGETCETCPSDCGRCPLDAYVYAIIASVCILIMATFISIVAVSCHLLTLSSSLNVSALSHVCDKNRSSKATKLEVFTNGIYIYHVISYKIPLVTHSIPT